MLLTQTQLVRKLKENGIHATRQNIKEHSDKGLIKFHESFKNGVRRLKFDYDEVIECFKTHNIVIESETSLSPDGATTLAEANTFKSIYQGKLQELKFRLESGQLVERSLVENTAYNVARIIRDKLLSLPERLSPELAVMSDPHAIRERLYEEINFTLDGLSKEGGELHVESGN